MKVTGHQLKEAISLCKLRLSAARNEFEDSLMAFPGEKKDPLEIGKKISDMVTSLAALEAAQACYNLTVKVEFRTDGPRCTIEKVPLVWAVKMAGEANEVKSMWQSAAHGQERRSRYSDNNVRTTDQIVAQPTISKGEALSQALEAARRALMISSSIAKANSTEVDIDAPWLNDTLLNQKG